MDLPELSEYHTLHSLHFRAIQEFLVRHRLRSDAHIYNLLKINYIIHIKGECWTSDIINSMIDKKKIERVVGIGTYYMMKDRYINKLEKDKVLGQKIEITNKGQYLLDQYTSWIREQEKAWHYKMRLSHKESKELKENT